MARHQGKYKHDNPAPYELSRSAFLNFVHYDTQVSAWGLRPHTDYGFVTILDAIAPGLQVEIDGAFQDVPVLPGHFVIYFGEALRFITAHSARPVGAVPNGICGFLANNPMCHGTHRTC